MLPLAFASAAASAIGLGPVSLASGLGEPLRITFPVFLQPGEEVGCVQVRARGDDLPSVFNTRSSVLRSGGQTRVEIRSAQPVNEPAIGLVVSVGCSSPISREYVLFLDPPVIPVAAAELESSQQGAASVASPPPRRSARPAPERTERASPAARTSNSADGAVTPPTPRARRARPNPVAAPSEQSAPIAGSPASATPRSVPATPAPAPVERRRDRLTVAPVDPSGTGPAGPQSTSPSEPPTIASPAATPSSVPVPPVAPPVVGPTAPEAAPPSTAAPGAASVSAPTPSAVVDASDTAQREQALRRQEAQLQVQIKQMSDQIAALRAQTAGLVNRNQVLQESTFSPKLIWLLIGLAVFAILVAGWMAWRYTQLRRSVEGSAWWTGNTAQDPSDHHTAAGGAETRGGVVALDPGTRLASKPVTQIDPRATIPVASGTSAPSASSLPASRTTARSPRYQAPIDTDFTVSDIEAAMATVRTVSSPREGTRPAPLEDSDFAPLGDPTQPSPFTEPPPPMPPNASVVSRDGNMVSHLGVPPLPSSTRLPPPLPPSTPLPRARPAEPPPEQSEPLDFKLDIPTTYDPLATDSMTSTMVIEPDQAGLDDFDGRTSPVAVDFDLPATTIAPLEGPATGLERSPPRERHGATALDDLFPSLASRSYATSDPGEQEPTSLTATEVDRLTTTAVDGPDDEQRSSPRYRLARFADLMNQVDEVSSTEPLQAIALLRQYVLRDEQIPTLFWLKLFELYRTVGKKSVYEALGEHFAQRYHRPMVGWDQSLADRVPQTPLSAMTSIDRDIEAQWGHQEGLERMRALLCDRDQSDAVVFNAVLQRDILDAAKVFPRDGGPTASQVGEHPAA